MACGVSPAVMAKRAKDEGWRVPARAGAGASIAARIHAARLKLLEAVERRQRTGEDGEGGLEAAGIAELTAVARMLDKLGEDTREEPRVNENQVDHEDDIAAIIERLDAKIVELATYLAGRLAEDELSRRGAEGGGSRMDR